MTYVTLDEFIAEIETIFQNYADTNDIDRISIKGWVIERLRKFGKNICELREAVVGVKNSRALLPENFKSLTLALKLEGEIAKKQDKIKEIPYKKYITHDVVWDRVSQEYIKDNCQSQVVMEYLLIEKEPVEHYMDVVPLSLMKSIQKDSIDLDCYNLHPSIRHTYPHQISITNRALNTNFREGLIYIQYNSLPTVDDEIAIPIITTGDIYKYITLMVKISIAENLIINNKNPAGLQTLLPLWIQQERLFYVQAQSESNWSTFSDKEFNKKVYAKRTETLNRFNLPK